MKVVKIILLTIFLVLLIVLGTLFITGYFSPPKAGLLVDTDPPSTVFVNGERVGTTKYDGVFKPGEVVVKLVPESFDKPLPPYETKVKLVSGVKTIVQRAFLESEEKSSGAIISFEKSDSKNAQISVVSIPDAAQVLVDGQVRGNTPLKLSSVSIGEHTLTLESQGYEDKEIDVMTYKGFKLTAVFKLSPKDELSQVEENPTPEPIREEKVKILKTGTGFLKVRLEPSTLTREVGRVIPGEFYKLLDTDDETGWYKIEYKDGEEGWISNKYAEKEDELESSPLPSPNATPTPKPTPND